MTMATGLWVFLFIIAVLLLFAVLSNLVVILCVFRNRKLRTVTNVLICNLAVSDILLAGYVLPQRLHDISHKKHYHEGTFLCKTVHFAPVFIITSSIYTLVCISFERRRAITSTQGAQMSLLSLLKVIPALWIFSAIIGVPTLLEYDVSAVVVDSKNTTPNTTYDLFCGSQTMHVLLSTTNAVFVTMLSYILPVILMFKNYFHLAQFVWDTGRTLAMTTGCDDKAFRRAQSRIRVVKLLIAVAVIFALSWLPYFVMLPYAKLTGQDASYDASGFVNLFLISLATFSTAYNVVLYVLYNPSFSSAIKELFLSTKCRKGELYTDTTIQRNTSEALNYAFSPDNFTR